RITMGVSILLPHFKSKALCHDISKEGCYFQNLDLGAVGEIVSIIIDLPDIGMIPIEAEISHKGDGRSTGLHFIDMDPADAEKLDFFVNIFQDP
ncbi:MAG TPA: PilZ domain-containing protein, partial [Thermodesulfobacteriota bacterium]|nr:PilZ domain-containing protein [Thermodesulfobacteriota bacterium]